MFSDHSNVSTRNITGWDFTTGNLAIFASALVMAAFGAAWVVAV